MSSFQWYEAKHVIRACLVRSPYYLMRSWIFDYKRKKIINGRQMESHLALSASMVTKQAFSASRLYIVISYVSLWKLVHKYLNCSCSIPSSYTIVYCTQWTIDNKFFWVRIILENKDKQNGDEFALSPILPLL